MPETAARQCKCPAALMATPIKKPGKIAAICCGWPAKSENGEQIAGRKPEASGGINAGKIEIAINKMRNASPRKARRIAEAGK